VGEEQCSLSLEQQIRADILAGESENREMKTFFNPDNNQPMRDRVIDSAIAFANTNGGHIYIGVEDHGQLSGNAKLLRTSTDRSLTPEKAARELSAKVRKHLIENIRPVVDIRASEICIASDWVIRLTIESSQQIVSDHANHVLIRSGASNRIPDPSWHGDRRLVHPALPF
jgi:predicted HTH transcriptional regulator